MKTLIFTVLTSSSIINYYISKKYILYERISKPDFEFLDTLPDAAPSYRILDMQTGLEHKINKSKTERTINKFSDPGRWEVQGKTFIKYEIMENLKIYECNCQRVQVWEKVDIKFLGDNSFTTPKSFIFCKMPIVFEYIKNKEYLTFLHFYNRYSNIAPGEFTLSDQVLFAEGTAIRDIEKIEFQEKDIEADFFDSFLAVPESK